VIFQRNFHLPDRSGS